MKEELFNKALDAFHEWQAKENAYIMVEPEIEYSRRNGNYIYLANHQNDLGSYNIKNDSYLPKKG